MDDELEEIGKRNFENVGELEVDFGLVAGIGGAAVVVNLKDKNRVAKVEKLEITGNARELAEKMEFITIKWAVERMKKEKEDCSLILEPEKVFIHKAGNQWLLITGKIYLKRGIDS